MKKLFFLIFSVFFTQQLLSQTVTYTDSDNNGIIEYLKKSEDGSIIERGFYFNEKPYGTWKSYWENGNLRCIAQFKYGLRYGVWKFYDFDGKLQHEVTYEDNRVAYAVQHRYFE